MPDDAPRLIDEGWWEILKLAASNAARDYPFATLVAILLALGLVSVGPYWLWLHYRFLRLRMEHKERFERIRRGQDVDGTGG